MSNKENLLDSFTVNDDDMTNESFGEYEDDVEEREGGILTDDVREELEEDEPTETEETEETEEEETDEEDNTSADIPFDEFVNSWKSAGLLSDDFTLPDKPTIKAFKDAVFDNIYKPLKEAATSQIEDDYEQLKAEKGLHVIEIAEKIAKGVSPVTASDGEIIDRLVSLDIDSDTDDAVANREKLMRTMHQLNGVSEKKIDKLVQMSQDDGEDIEDAQEAKTYLKKLKQTREAEEIAAEDRRKKDYEESVGAYYTMIEGLINKGEIMEGANKSEFFKDLTEPSVYVDVDTGERKMKKKFSKWQKAQMDAGVVITPTVDAVNKKDIKKYLEIAHQLMYGEAGKKKLKEKVKKEVEDELDAFLTKRKPAPKNNTSEFFSITIP